LASTYLPLQLAAQFFSKRPPLLQHTSFTFLYIGFPPRGRGFDSRSRRKAPAVYPSDLLSPPPVLINSHDNMYYQHVEPFIPTLWWCSATRVNPSTITKWAYNENRLNILIIHCVMGIIRTEGGDRVNPAASSGEPFLVAATPALYWASRWPRRTSSLYLSIFVSIYLPRWIDR